MAMIRSVKTEFIRQLEAKRLEILPQSPAEYTNIVADAVHTSMNLISRSDALYHDVEHTCLVTLCGQSIFAGKKTLEGELSGPDWLHFTLALLFHDIGYVKNILNGDDGFDQVINEKGDTIALNDGNTDASLTPYHVERGKLFIEQRHWHPDVDKQLLKDLISCTQFPIPERGSPSGDLDVKFQELADLVGSSDLIGQLADPMYDVKMPRLFHEFNETGAADKMGISTPVELRNNYPNFYINLVKPHIGRALHYLGVTDEGQSWVASLNYHVFSQAHRQVLEKGGIDLLNEITKLDVQNYRTDDLILEILRRICMYKRWPIGHAYVVQRNDKEVLLKSTGVWHNEVVGEAFEDFKKISEEYVFYSGEGLPGQAYEKESVQTIYDVTMDANFPRAALAKNVSVRGAFAFPLKDGLGVRWVLEFFSPEPELLDPSFLELMEHVAIHINQGFSGK
jgi:hypothetical protein